LELGVALDELVTLHDRGQVALVGDVEEDRQAAVDEPDEVQLPDREPTEGERDRDRDQAERPPEVAHDQDWPPPQAIHPDAGGQAQEDERQEFDRAEEGELERRDLEDRRRDEGQGEQRHLRPEDADGLGRPELQEVRMPEEAGPAGVGRRHGRPQVEGHLGRGAQGLLVYDLTRVSQRVTTATRERTVARWSRCPPRSRTWPAG